MSGTQDKSQGGIEGRTVQQTLAELGEQLTQVVACVIGPPLARLSGRIAWRLRVQAAGYCLLLLAAVWAAIGLTLAAAQHLPLWASYLCVSGFFAVGAAGAFIIPSLKNGNSKVGRESNLEGDNQNG